VSDVVNLTTSWQTYTVELITKSFDVPIGPGNVGDDVLLDLNVIPHAVAGDQYFFDNVELERVGAAPNLLLNGGFLTTGGWTHYRPGDESFTAIENSFGNNVNFIAKVTINNAASNNLQLYQTGFPLTIGKRYMLEYDVNSSDGSSIHTAVMKHTAPYTLYVNATLGTTPAGFFHHFLSFNLTRSSGFSGTSTDTRVRFYFVNLARTGTTYYIDNVRLYEIPNPFPKDGEGNQDETPSTFALYQNYPNPFNPTTTISYALPKQSHVSVKVFNTLGQEVASLVDEVQDEGVKNVEFNASNLASGVYFYRIVAGDYVESKKLVLLR
jgi:hypothetical protein